MGYGDTGGDPQHSSVGEMVHSVGDGFLTRVRYGFDIFKILMFSITFN